MCPRYVRPNMDPRHPDLELDFLATVFEVARTGICIVDETGMFVRVNPAFCQLVDYSPAELVGRHYAMCAPPSVAEVKDKFLDALLGDSPKIPREWQIRRRQGELFDGLVSFRPITRPDGRRFVVITFSDITDSKRAQAQIEALNRDLEQGIRERTSELTGKIAELVDSEQKYHRVINLTREGFWLINARNETIEVNAALCQMLGYREDEMLGRTPLEFVDDRYRHVLEQRMVPMPVPAQATYEVVLVRKDGRPISAAYNATAVMNAQGEREFSFAFITDVSERKRLEEDLLETLAREKELSEIKSRFVSMTSHEFRTPLAAILSSTELLADYGERLPVDEKQELTDMIKASVMRMTHMLDDILLIGRADAGRLEFSPQPLDLRAFCARILDEVGKGNEGRHQMILRHRGTVRPVNVDEKLLRHILINLVGNAAKYSPTGGLVELTATCGESDLQLEVADQGMGIPREDLPGLFETFHRGSNVGNIPGTGLGLAIVKKAVDLHGGTISVETQLGKGTRFTVTLPEVPGAQVG